MLGLVRQPKVFKFTQLARDKAKIHVQIYRTQDPCVSIIQCRVECIGLGLGPKAVRYQFTYVCLEGSLDP